MSLFKKKKKPAFNNPYKVPNEKADEIRRLSNSELALRAAQEYKSMIGYINVKKDDVNIENMRKQIKDQSEEVESHEEVVALKEQLKAKKEEVLTENLATLKEEFKNLVQPFNEDIAATRGLFRVAMDELASRRETGVLTAKA